jgi:hypothetical protein
MMEPTFYNVAHGLWMTRLEDAEAPTVTTIR